jgi:putative SOS response-associated peptidase YedK
LRPFRGSPILRRHVQPLLPDQSQEAIRQLFRVERDRTGNQPPLPGNLPDQLAPVIRTAHDGVREMILMCWGFPPPPHLGSRPAGAD